MIRISLSYIYNLATRLEPLGSLPAGRLAIESIVYLYDADQALSELAVNSIFAKHLRGSFPAAAALKAKTSFYIDPAQSEHIFTHYNVAELKSLLNHYRIALLSELETLSSYFVVQKGGYDTWSLLNEGEVLFPLELARKVPEALSDAREASRALAFEMSTAVGFHSFRVLESVLRKYFTHITGGAALPKVRNLGIYIKALRQNGNGDPKVLAALDQIRDLHRNPLIHPEVLLSLEEALDIVGLVRSAVSTMLNVLPPLRPTTLSALGAAFVPSLPGAHNY